jgi:putative ABC transport system permease protein
MPAGFSFPSAVDVWASLGPQLGNTGLHYQDRGYHSGWFGVARLKSGVTLAQAAAGMDIVAQGLESEFVPNKDFRVRIDPLLGTLVGHVRRSLSMLLGAVGLVLLVACANLANLMLTRAMAQQKDIAVRAASGATQTRIVRQLISEGLLLSFLGSAVGLLLAYFGLPLILAVANNSIPRADTISLNPIVLLFTLFIAALTGVLFGLAPALQASRVDLQTMLRKSSRGTSAARGRLREALVVVEFALTLVLLVGAGLFLRSFLRLQQVDPGFSSERLLSFRFDLPERKYTTEDLRARFYQELIEKMRGLPGVQSVGVASRISLDPTDRFPSPFTIEGRPPLTPGELQMSELSVVSADYFQTVGIPLIRGRSFNATDDRNHLRDKSVSSDTGTRWIQGINKIIIDEEFAKRYWPNADPVGQRMKLEWGAVSPVCEIVGVVGHVKPDRLSEPGQFAQAYLSFQQAPRPGMAVLVKTTTEPQSMITSVRQQVASLDPEQPVYDTFRDSLAINRATAFESRAARKFCFARAGARRRRHLRRAVAAGFATNARDWDSRRAWRATARRAATGSTGWHEARANRHLHRLNRLPRLVQSDRNSAVWRHGNGSGYIHQRLSAVAVRGLARVSGSSASRHEGRSAGGAEIRMRGCTVFPVTQCRPALFSTQLAPRYCSDPSTDW